MKFKKIMLIFSLIIILLGIIGVVVYSENNRRKAENNEEGKLNIVVTTFSAYDFTRQIVGDKANINLLLNPGADSHSFEPNPQDIIDIQNSDMFIYVGGETEQWAVKVLDSMDEETKSNIEIVKLADTIEVQDEEEIEGAEDVHVEDEHAEDEDGLEEDHDHDEVEGAFEEHIWTSPANAIKMVETIKSKIADLDKNNEQLYTANADEYIAQIKDVQAKIQDIVDNKVRNRLVFGDKMPMQYFLNEYNLEVSAAFTGCSTEADPSTKTITYLIDKVKEENIPVVLYIELSSGKVAKTIADETGAKAMQIQTLHNVSKEDFDNGETYVSLMSRNLDVLKEALQ